MKVGPALLLPSSSSSLLLLFIFSRVFISCCTSIVSFKFVLRADSDVSLEFPGQNRSMELNNLTMSFFLYFRKHLINRNRPNLKKPSVCFNSTMIKQEMHGFMLVYLQSSRLSADADGATRMASVRTGLAFADVHRAETIQKQKAWHGAPADLQ